MIYFTVLLGLIICVWADIVDQEEEAKKYLERVNKLHSQKNYEHTLAEWDYESNILNETLAKKVF